MKIFSFIALALLTPLVSSAAYNDVNVGATTNISIGSSNYTIDGTVAEQISTNGSSITINFNSGGLSGATIVSGDKHKFTVDPTSALRSFSCGSSSSTLVINRGSSDSLTVTVNPVTNTCSGEDNSGTGSTGGGGGSVTSPATATTIAQVVAPEVAKPSAVAQLVSPVFNSDLQLGSKNADVKRLQELLAKDKAIYPEGRVTGYYGSLTVKAIRRFQAKYGLPQVGRVGPQTRAKLNQVFGDNGNSSSAPEASVQQPSVSNQNAQQKQLEDLKKKLDELLKKLSKPS